MEPKPDKIAESLLFIGPGSQGGMLSVMESYRQMFHPYKVIYSQREGGKLKKALIALRAYGTFIGRMVTDPHIKIVHINVAAGNSLWRKKGFMLLGHLFKKKVILHVHAGAFKTFYLQHPNKVKKCLQKADCIIALSQQWKDFFTSIGMQNVTVVPNPVEEPSERVQPASSPIHFLFLGKIAQNKGIYDLLKALSKVKEDFILDIGGSGEVQELKQQIQNFHLSERVKFHGWVTGAEKESLLQSASVFVLPSYWEGVPVSILEAMMHRIPVITTNVGGIPSIVEDGKNGILINPGDIQSLTSAIEKFLNNPELREEMGKEGYNKCQPYKAGNVRKELCELYNHLLS